MNYEELNKIVQEIRESKRDVSSLKDEKVPYIKAIGRQFALSYKSAENRSASDADEFLNKLIEIRQLVKSKLNMNDVLMNRFLKERENSNVLHIS